MKIIAIQESQRKEILRRINQVFKRKKRPNTTPIHCCKLFIKQED